MKTSQSIPIILDDETLDVVREAVSSGDFSSENDVVDEAVRQWAERREDDARHLQDIVLRIRQSLDDPRPSLTLEEAEAEMTRFMAEQERKFSDAAS
jgi:antitoxin ParD1/3/4